MPDTEPRPMQSAIIDLMMLLHGLHGTLALINESTPSPKASAAEQEDFLQAMHPVVSEALMSLTLASGSIAGHIRRHRGNLN